jgi:hypothetical protein
MRSAGNANRPYYCAGRGHLEVVVRYLDFSIGKRQPNLLLAAMRRLFGTPGDWPRFRDLLANEWEAGRAIMIERSTQTNEPQAVVLQQGCSTGKTHGFGKPRSFTASQCETVVPTRMPDVVRRAGLDLNPFDVSEATQAGWLETLVCPEQTVWLANLRAAIKLAAASKPPVARRDLRHDLCAANSRGSERSHACDLPHRSVGLRALGCR